MPGTRLDRPTNSATRGVAGRRYRSSGVPICSMKRCPSPPPDRKPQGLLLIVSHEHGGDAQAQLQPTDLIANDTRTFASSADSGSSSRSTRGLSDQCAGQRGPAAAAHRKAGGGLAVGERTSPTRSRACAARCSASALATLRRRSPKAVFLHHSQVRKQRVGLKDHADIALIHRDVGHVRAAEQHRTRIRLLEAGDDSQRRGLPAPRRPEQRDELAGAMSRSTPCRTVLLPKLFRISRSSTRVPGVGSMASSALMGRSFPTFRRPGRPDHDQQQEASASDSRVKIDEA